MSPYLTRTIRTPQQIEQGVTHCTEPGCWGGVLNDDCPCPSCDGTGIVNPKESDHGR